MMPDRRVSPDRRRRPTPILSRYTLFGRREGARREEDRKRHLYVDRYSVRLFLLLMVILIMGVADAVLTAYHLGAHDVMELNPAMRFLLDISPKLFFMVKYVVTSICLLVLCLRKNVPAVRYCLAAIIAVYVVILANHVYLLFALS
jgi:hypothetical protein